MPKIPLLALLTALALPATAAAHTLPVPKDVTTSATPSGVAIAWKKSGDGHVDGYNVYRRTPAGDWAGIARVADTTYTDAKATTGT